MQPGFGNLGPNAKSVNLIQLKSTHDGDFWSTILCCKMTPKKKSYADFLPSLTFEKCNMDNQLGCSICVLVWLKVYTWLGEECLAWYSEVQMSLLSTAPQQISTHSHTQNQKNQYDTNPKLSDRFSLVHTALNQSINKSTQRERDHRKPQNGEK